jgi:hypothetical protein
MWQSFILGFCKVQFLCYRGDANWLGWLVMGLGVLVVVHFTSKLFDYVWN